MKILNLFLLNNIFDVFYFTVMIFVYKLESSNSNDFAISKKVLETFSWLMCFFALGAFVLILTSKINF